MTQKKKPVLRFKGFTDDWEQRKLGELAEFNPKASLPDSFEYVDLESVVGTRIINHRTEKKDSAPSRAQRLAQPGDVFYQTVRPYQRNNCLFTGAEKSYVFSTGYAQLRSHGDSYFLLTMLQKDDFVNSVMDRCTGTSYPAINSNELAEINVIFPTIIQEQKELGQFFKNIDNLITLHQRKYEKLRNLKKFFLEKIFPQNGKRVPEVRFAGFTGDWEQRKLGELAKETYGGGTPKTSIAEYWAGNIPWIQSADITEHDVNCVIPKKYISKDAIRNSAAKLVPKDSIAIVTRVGVGKLAIMPFPYATSQDFLSLSNLKIDIHFSAYLLYKKLQEDMNAVQGTSIKGITKKELLDKSVLIPTLIEQEKIGAYLSNIDHLITLHQRKLEKLQNLKKAALDKMFV